MAYSEKQWETVRAFYERGFSLSEIAARPEVEIKDRKTISRKANNEGWVKGEKATLVETEIKTKQAVNEIATAKATLNATELDIHNTIVTERMKDEAFFRKASLLVAQTAIRKIQTESCSMMDLRAAQELIGKGKENIYGKSAPDVQVNTQNNQVVLIDAPDI